MSSEKKNNSYLRMGILLLCSAVIGGVIGVVSFALLGTSGGGIHEGFFVSTKIIQEKMPLLLFVILLISVALEEFSLYKLKSVQKNLLRVQDEECDKLEYQAAKISSVGQMINILSQALCVIILSFGYSFQYFTGSDANRKNFLYACILFLICFVYSGFWQVRYVKAIQISHPEKKGDPSSLKFQKEWLQNCDEAEREVIYQSSYQTFLFFNKIIPVFLVVSMFGNLFFHTGVFAVTIVAVIWLMVTVSYLCSSLKIKEIKANR